MEGFRKKAWTFSDILPGVFDNKASRMGMLFLLGSLGVLQCPRALSVSTATSTSSLQGSSGIYVFWGFKVFKRRIQAF